MIVLRVIFTLGSLSVMVLTRHRMGENTFAPWSNKQYGKRSRDKFKSTAPTRMLMIFFLYIWVRLFWILQMRSIAEFHLGEDVSLVSSIITHSFRLSYPWEGFFFLPGHFADATYLLWLSYLVPIAGIFHFFNLNVYDRRDELPDPLSLGKSWLFHGIFKLKDDITVWSFAEPVMIALIGAALLFFGGYSMWWFSIFLWIAAAFMAIQGIARYNRERQDVATLKHSALKSRKLAERLKGKKARSYDDDENIAIPI